MIYDRQYVERRSMVGAGIVDQTDEWYMARILGNIPIYCRKDDKSVTTCLINEGFWEAWITAWVLNNVGEETFFIDIGANTGYYSIIASRQGARVMAFEPNPKYHNMIRASRDIGWDQSRGDWLAPNHFNVYPYALSSQVGEVKLTIPNDLQGSATIRMNAIDDTIYPSSVITVPATTLDRCLAGIPKQNTVIKMDAEGAEEFIWDGMSETLVRQKPTVLLEYTPGAYTEKFLDKLENYSDLAWINHAGNEEPVSREWILAQSDWVMLVLRNRT